MTFEFWNLTLIKYFMNQTVKNILGGILYFSFIIILIYGIPKGLSAALDTPYPMAAITSGSMWPVLKKGDIVLIKGVKNKNNIKKGDIVVYKNEKGFTIHRVIEIRDTELVTKGDANNISDAPIAYEDLIGRAVNFNNKVFKIPWAGNISLYLNKDKF